jgi:hypothetical protein
MSDTKKVCDALMKLLIEVSKLDGEQLNGIIGGTIKIKLESTEKPLPPSKVDADVDGLKKAILASTSRAAAILEIEKLGMNVTKLKAFAKDMSLKKISSLSGKENVIKAIVDQMIGYRFDANATSRT